MKLLQIVRNECCFHVVNVSVEHISSFYLLIRSILIQLILVQSVCLRSVLKPLSHSATTTKLMCDFYEYKKDFLHCVEWPWRAWFAYNTTRFGFHSWSEQKIYIWKTSTLSPWKVMWTTSEWCPWLVVYFYILPFETGIKMLVLNIFVRIYKSNRHNLYIQSGTEPVLGLMIKIISKVFDNVL